MFSLTVLFITFLAMVLVKGEGTVQDILSNDPNCQKMFKATQRSNCCEFVQVYRSRSSEPLQEEVEKEITEKCKKLPSDLKKCERQVCMMATKGWVAPDGTIIKPRLEELQRKYLEGFPDLSNAIVDKCVNGDLSVDGLTEMCDLMKVKLCIEFEIIRHCPSWRNDGVCEGVEKAASECMKQLP